MSKKSKKIGFYRLSILNEDVPVSPQALKDLTKSIMNLPEIKRKEDIPGTNKFHLLIGNYIANNEHNLLFVSAKHHHIPPVIDSTTVVIRDNPKQLTEGDMENTHVALKYTKDEIYLLLEERNVGITIRGIIAYFNKYFSKLINQNNINYIVKYDVMISKSFIDAMCDVERVKVGEIHMDKKIIGSEALNFADRYEEIQDDVVVIFKAKRSYNAIKQIKSVYNQMENGNNNINKIRVYGTSKDGSNILLDSDFCRNIQYAEAKLDPLTGLVDTTGMFNKMNSIIQFL